MKRLLYVILCILAIPAMVYAGVKISDLTALGTSPASDDVIPIVDISTSTTKKITITNLFTSPAFTTAILPITSDGAAVGSSYKEWSDAYFADGAVIYFQDDQSVTLTSSADGLTFGQFPMTPSAAPDADYEVANKKYVDENIGGGGGAPTDAKYIVQQADGTLSAEQALGALATGILKSTTTTGVVSIAVDGTDFLAPTRIDDTKGNGDTDYVWSADKVFDQLALKATTSEVDVEMLTDVDGEGTAATYALFDDNDGTYSFRAIADGDVPNDITIDTANVATHVTITDNEAENEENEVPFVENASAPGNNGLESDSGFTYNPSTGTLTSAAFAGALTGNVTGDVSGSSGSCTGNAATATTLETAMDIGGVSFNGSANINLPGVNTAGNQDTSGNAATATLATTATTANAGDSATAFFDAGTIEHEYGGLEDDVHDYNGLIRISGGSTSNITDAAGLETALGLGAFASDLLGYANAAAVVSGIGAATTSTKLDDFGTPDDNTDLNVTTTYHGLCPKLSNNAATWLDGTGSYSAPTAGEVGAATTSTKIDDFASPDDNTDLNVTTSAHGLCPKLSNNAATWLDGTGAYSAPTAGEVGAATTSTKLDDFASPDDNTDLNVTTSAHGLCPKLDNESTHFLNGQGGWSAPAGGGDVTKVLTPVDNQVGVWTGDGTIEGDADFTFDGTDLTVTGDVAAGSLTITPVDDPLIHLEPDTASESEWWIGVNHDSVGDDNDPLELRQNATPGSDVRVSVSTGGFVTATGLVYEFGALATNLTYSGDVISATAGENVTIGDICYLKSDGKFWMADANVEAEISGLIVMATASINADASGVFLIRGLIRDDSWDWTTGASLWIPESDGNPTASQPADSGDFVRLIGWAKGADYIWFDPDKTYVEVE